jgi:Spy/CpxP family protein refolding chaperone
MKRKQNPLRRRVFTVLGTLGIAGILLGAGFAHAQEGKGHKGSKKLDRVCQKINCTEDQKKELKSVVKELRTDLKTDRQAVRGLHEKLAVEFEKATPDERAMKRLYATIDKHRANMRDRTHDAMMEIHGLLQPAQRSELRDVVARGGLFGRRGHGGHGKGPEGEKRRRKPGSESRAKRG